jgi:DNA-binding MarR family transcriptional regulator
MRIDVSDPTTVVAGASPATTSDVAQPAASGRSPADEYADLTMNSLRRIVQALRGMGASAQRDYAVTAAQLFVLRQIAMHSGQSMTDLARRTFTRESSVSEVVGRLVTRDLVERRVATTDHRRVEVHLTPAGQRIVAEAPETVQERLAAGFHALPDDVRRSLAQGLAAWLAASGLGDVPASMFFESASRHRHGAT